MEHVIKQQRDGQQVRLTAEKGWLLKSKKSGKTYREIETLDLKRWEVIPDAETGGKAASKREQSQTGLNSAEREQANQQESAGKPKTTKRANRKGK